jgi:hypothetical protein
MSSLLDTLTQWIDNDSDQLAYLKIDPSQVDREAKPASLTAGVHYVRLRLASMFLKKQTQWFTSWYPAVHSVVRFDFGDQKIEIPNIADSTKLVMQQTPQGDVIARNFILTPTMPFNGGVVSITAGLFAVKGQNYLASVLKTLGNFAGLLSVPQLSLALNVVQPLALGIQELFNSANANMHLGVHDAFSAGELTDGYFAAIRAPRNDIHPRELFVVNDELCQGPTLREARPFIAADHMLFRAELLDKRDDWESLKSIQEPYQEALNALRDQSQATHYMRTALLRATLSPDLTSVDKRRVVDRLIEKFEDAKRIMSFRGAFEGEVTLKQVMRGPMSVKAALGKGEPTVQEVFSALGETRSLDMSGVTWREDITIGQPPKFEKAKSTTSSSAEEETVLQPENEKTIFYFATKGDGVQGSLVKVGTEFDLVFNYGTPTVPVLLATSGGVLDELLKVEKAELDISIMPRGFTLNGSKWVQRATFTNGVIEGEVVFHLKAYAEIINEAGFYVTFERQGAILYEFFIPMQLTENVEAAAKEQPLFQASEFNLDELAAAKNREPRNARVHIFAAGDRLSITFDNLNTDESFQVETNKLTRSALSDLLGETKQYLDSVPNHTIWTVLDDPLAKPKPGSSAEKAFNECLERVATAGWILYKKLADDEAFQKVLKAIDDLAPGSNLSIRTNCAFLPWEILNSADFNWKYPEDIKKLNPIQPQNFWGYKLSIECLLVGEKQSYKTPASNHESSPAYVSLNIFRTIDEGFAGSVGRKFLPGQSHEDFCKELAPDIKSEIHKSGAEILKVFNALNYDATLIYLLCHGQNDKPLDSSQREKLQVDEKDFIVPEDLFVQYKYPRGPIVFLNSCSSGASSPLAFSSFLSQFRQKQALGLIATSFPVPITFGSAFGQELMRRYLKQQKSIGQALLSLRREQLANGNPVGLFYSLQCPADITSHIN